MPSGSGGNSQDRRRTRRAASRRTTATGRPETFHLTAEDADEIRDLVAAASGSTSLPLSDRDTAWDAGAAGKSLSEAQLPKAFFWRDPDGDPKTKAGYKLGFASAESGTLTAIFRGVTAAAGAIQGARGGVQIPDGDVAGVKSRIAGYYSKAAKKYGDDGIKPPWEAADGESAAGLLAYAELGPGVGVTDEEIGAEQAEYVERTKWWAEQIGEDLADDFGGRPSRGTKPDKRLKENDLVAQQPEDLALERLDAYRDRRPLATAYVKIRPDLAGFRAEVEAVVEDALRRVDALRAAAGDVAWGPEEGFVDLICDVNEILSGDEGSRYCLDEVGYGYGPRAIDASVKLDKVLICDDNDYWVAPITIGADGEPVLAERAEWRPVEQGWVETPDDDESMSASLRVRFALRDVVLADGALAPPLPDEHKPGEKLPTRRPGVPEPASEPVQAVEGEIPWTATFVPEGELTEDGRAFAPGSLLLPPAEGSRELPLTLMAMIETSAEGGHDGAKVAGRIDRLWREGDFVKASGVFDAGEYGQEIARMVGDEVLRGLSVDIAPLEWERTPRSDWFDDEGNWIARLNDDGEWVPVGAAERTPEDAVDLLFGEGSILVITKGVIGMATVCPFPAFAKASISLAASGAVYRYTSEAAFDSVGDTALTASAGAESLTAAAAGLAPLKPPAEWFADPELDELTPMTITDDGRVFGHAWEWGTCHLAFDECIVAPHSQTEYAYFRLGEIECEGGDLVPVGKITIDAPHAGQRLTRADATRHYDHTGTVAAHVTFGEDEFGGWFAGAIHPDISEEKLRLLRGATVSGDWRGVDRNLELIALLAVNVPGFPVPRARALVAAGVEDERSEVLSLTAAGIVREATLTAEQSDEIRALAEAA